MDDRQESERIEDIHRKAEEQLSESRPEDEKCVSEVDALALLHQLQVHQIELQMQNEDLQRAHDELEARVHDLRKIEEKYRILFTSMSEGFALHEIICNEHGEPINYRFLDVNPAFERLTGLSYGDVIGRKVLDVLPETERYWIEKFGRVALTGEQASFEEYSGALEKYFEVHAYCPVPGQFAVLFVDVTDRKLAEARQQAFYRRTILAATQGKLAVMDRDEVRELAGPAIRQWDIDSLESISIIRKDAVAMAESMGMDQLGISKLVTCIVEGGSNALKHAGSGRASLHKAEDGLLLMLEDEGPGIGAMNIPDVALLRGYSTAGTLGMGYKLMLASCRKVYLATGPGGTTAAFEVPIHNDDLDTPQYL